MIGRGRRPAFAPRWTPNKIAGLIYRLDPTLLAAGLIASATDAGGSGRTLTATGAGRPTADSSVTWGAASRQTLKLTAASVLAITTGGVTGASPFFMGRVYKQDATTGYASMIMGQTGSTFAAFGGYASASRLWFGHQASGSPNGQIYATSATGGGPDTTTIHADLVSFDGSLLRVYADGVLWPGAVTEASNLAVPAAYANFTSVAGYGFSPHAANYEAIEHVGEAIWGGGTATISASDLLRWYQWVAAHLSTSGAPIGTAAAHKAQIVSGGNSRDVGYGTTDPTTDNLYAQTCALLSTPINLSVNGVTGQSLGAFLAVLYSTEQRFAGYLSMMAAGPRIVCLGAAVDNDIGCGAAATTSLATAQTNLLAEIALVRGFCPSVPIVVNTMLPSGSSARDSGYDANRVTFNNWLEAGSSGADVLADTGRIAALQTSPASNAYFYNPGTANANGIHLGTNGTALQAPVLQAALAPWIT